MGDCKISTISIRVVFLIFFVLFCFSFSLVPTPSPAHPEPHIINVNDGVIFDLLRNPLPSTSQSHVNIMASDILPFSIDLTIA